MLKKSPNDYLKMKQLATLLVCCFVAVSPATSSIIHPKLQHRILRGAGGDKDKGENVMVSFNQNIDTVIQRINSMSFPNSDAKRTALTEAQEQFTQAAQQPLQSILSGMGVKYQSFWINNKMIVQNADGNVVNAIARAPGVEKVEPEPVAEMARIPGIDIPEFGANSTNSTAEWGIRRIGADMLWAANLTGEGVVVAGIDSGVRGTHEALRNNWRKEMGWFDPFLFRRQPWDINGHGTHTMGTIAGRGGIGVAPGAKWIACMGCNPLNCRSEHLFACGQWVQCPNRFQNLLRPTNNCSAAPDIVSNSWGGGNDDGWYDGVIRSWRAAGIIPVFALGNSGPTCKTANSPGDRPNVIAVGSIEENSQISSFSSRGPTKDGRVVPNIVAPGGRVRSSWSLSDTAYNTISGTSMACPHVSGVIALMKQRNPEVDFDMAYNAIINTADTSSLEKSTAKACGNKDNDVYPNNVFGFGLIDAIKSVSAIKAA